LSDGEILPGDAPRAARRVQATRPSVGGIAIRTDARVLGVGPRRRAPRDRARRRRPRRLGDRRAHVDWLATSPLPRDDAGFVRVGPTLAVAGRDDLFAAATARRSTARRGCGRPGVYGGPRRPDPRSEPARARDGTPLVAYRPQRHVLSLLHLGDRTALASKWGIVAVGPLGLALESGPWTNGS
jgi:selenide,water dikinase